MLLYVLLGVKIFRGIFHLPYPKYVPRTNSHLSPIPGGPQLLLITLLAPKVVELSLRGQLSAKLTLVRVMDPLPIEWAL